MLELDFSQLNKIGATHATQEATKDNLYREVSQNKENLTTGQIEALELKHQREPIKRYPNIEKERAEREAIAQTYRQQQENIRKAGTLRAEINKGIQAGQDLEVLLLKAIECISLMTGDKTSYEQNKRDLEGNIFK